MERSREQWISGARSHDGTCIVYLLNIVLEWEAVVREAVDVVIKRQSLLVDRRFAAGHCTLKCSCCEKARGYRLAWILKSKARKLNTLESLNARWRRVMRASLVGLVVGSNEDPRELIQPPRYEH